MSKLLPTSHGVTVVPLMTHIWVSPLKPPTEEGVEFGAIKMADVQLAPYLACMFSHIFLQINLLALFSALW